MFTLKQSKCSKNKKVAHKAIADCVTDVLAHLDVFCDLLLSRRTQIAVKTKTFPILTSNETIIITKTQRNSDFWNLQGKRKLLLKIEEFGKPEIKLERSTEEEKRLLV